jgi:hypothetical protein
VEPKLKADRPLKVGQFILIPISEGSTFSIVRGDKAAFTGYKRAVAVVVLTPQGSMALKVNGEKCSVEDLMETVLGLRECVMKEEKSLL